MLDHVPEQVLEQDQGADPGRQARPARTRWLAVVHFLASDHSSFITGAVWDVNGGQDM